MLVTAFVDPSALDKENFKNTSYGYSARDFYANMVKNGLLLSDKNKKILDLYLRKSQYLNGKFMRIRMLIEEVRKNPAKRVIFLEECSYAYLLEMCNALDLLAPDVIIACPSDRIRLSKVNRQSSIEIISFNEYEGSNFEKQRDRFVNSHWNLGRLSDTERVDLFKRIVQFAKTIRIYDRIIGSLERPELSLPGIRFVLRLWERYGYFSKREGQNLRVDIYTCIKNRQGIAGQKSKIAQTLVEPLKRDLPSLSIFLHAKRDPKRTTHPRYLETNLSVLNLDRGFDFIDANNKFTSRENPVRLITDIENVSKELEHFRRLKNAFNI